MRHSYIENIERLTVKRMKYNTNVILKINKPNEEKIYINPNIVVAILISENFIFKAWH